MDTLSHEAALRLITDTVVRPGIVDLTTAVNRLLEVQQIAMAALERKEAA